MASSESKGYLVSVPQIRAPLTLEVDDSNSEFDVSSNDTLSQCDYTSQEEYQDVEEEEEEECFEVDESVQLSPMHAAPLRVTPVAHLSTFDDDDEEEEEYEDEDEEEGGGERLSFVRVPGNFAGAPPRIKMLDVEEENHEASNFVSSLPVSQSLLANDLEFLSGSDEELVVDEHGVDQVLGIRVACDEYFSATNSDDMSQHSLDSLNNEQFAVGGVVLNELEKEACDADRNDAKTDIIMQKLVEVEGTSVVVGDTSLLKSSVEDYDSSIMQEQNMSFNDLQEHSSQVHRITGEPLSEAFAENVYISATQTTEADGSEGVAADQVREGENLVCITRYVANSNAELHDSPSGFDSNDDAYYSNKIHSVESSGFLDPALLQECYLENDLSETILDVSLEEEVVCDYHANESSEFLDPALFEECYLEKDLSETMLDVSLEEEVVCDYHANVETVNLGYTAKEGANVELNAATQDSEREGSASDGDVDGLMSVALEQFREQISALSIVLGSKGSGKDSQEKWAVRSSHGTVNLPKDDAKAQFIYADSDTESYGSSGTITSADESSVFFFKDSASFGSLPYYNAQAGFLHNVTEKEKEKVQEIQAISVKFLRLVLRVNLSLEDSLVSKVLCRLVADIERRLNQEFVIQSAKAAAKKLEENCQDDLDFSLSILVLGRSGVGKSATINSIFGDMKVVTNAFEPATTSVKEVSGTIDGIKIRILDTPGLKTHMKEQAYNRNILSCIKMYMKKFPPDVILYVDRVDAQARDLNDLPILRTITTSFGPSIWQHAILTLTHAASIPLDGDGPSGSPLSYELFVAQKSYLVQQSITLAVHGMCQLSPSFMCPVALVDNHPLCGKNKFGDCVLPNGLKWKSQLLALCSSLKVLSEVSSVSETQTLFDQWKHFFFQDHSQPLSHVFSSLFHSPAHLKFSANWN